MTHPRNQRAGGDSGIPSVACWARLARRPSALESALMTNDHRAVANRHINGPRPEIKSGALGRGRCRCSLFKLSLSPGRTCRSNCSSASVAQSTLSSSSFLATAVGPEPLSFYRLCASLATHLQASPIALVPRSQSKQVCATALVKCILRAHFIQFHNKSVLLLMDSGCPTSPLTMDPKNRKVIYA